MRSHAQLHVLNQEISRANNFAAEEPPPASFTWLRNVLRSVTGKTLCDITNHQPPTTNHHLPTPPSPNLSTLNHLYLFFLWLRHKKTKMEKISTYISRNKCSQCVADKSLFVLRKQSLLRYCMRKSAVAHIRVEEASSFSQSLCCVFLRPYFS